MSSWSWSARLLRWHEQVAFTLAFVAWIEGQLFYSDLVRGITVGLYLGTLLMMIAGRHALYAILCSAMIVMAFTMGPLYAAHTAAGSGAVISAHVLAALMIMIPILNAWSAHRLARRGMQVTTG